MNFDNSDTIENDIQTKDTADNSEDSVASSAESHHHHHHHHHHHSSTGESSDSESHHHHRSSSGESSDGESHHHHHHSSSGESSDGGSHHHHHHSSSKDGSDGKSHRHHHRHSGSSGKSKSGSTDKKIKKKRRSKSRFFEKIKSFFKRLSKYGIRKTLSYYLSKYKKNEKGGKESEYKTFLKRVIFISFILLIFVLSYYIILTSSLQEESILNVRKTPSEVEVLKTQIVQNERKIKKLEDELARYKAEFGELDSEEENDTQKEENQNAENDNANEKNSGTKGDGKK